VAAEEPRKLGFTFQAPTVQSSGDSQSLFGQFNALSQSQPTDSGPGSFSDDPFASLGSPAPAPNNGLGGPPLTSETGSEILQGMIKSFMANAQLQESEEQCLEQGCSAFGSQAANVGQSIAMLGQQYETMKSGGIPQVQSAPAPAPTPASSQADFNNMFSGMFGGGSSSPPAPPPPAPLPPPAVSSNTAEAMFSWAQGRRLQAVDPVGLMGGGMMAASLAKSMKELGDIGGQIAEKCLQSDGKSTLKLAAANAKNPAYLAKAMSTNGPEAFGNLADAMSAWKSQDATSFGNNMGDAMRDILLSNNLSSTLPEGLPSKKVLANCTGGFLKGFFGPGMTATIKTPEMPNGLTVDLNKCVGNNVNLMQAMWGSVMKFYGQQATASAQASQDKQQQATLMAYAAMQMPAALKQCNIGPEQEQALKDAIASMGKGSSISYSIPSSGGVSKTEAVGDLADSIAGYQKLLTDPSSAPSFGSSVGSMFQKAVEATMSSKYYVDSSGNLRKKLLQLDGLGGKAGASSVATPVMFLLSMTFLLLALVAVKSRRAVCRLKESGGAHLNAGEDFDLECDDERPILEDTVG